MVTKVPDIDARVKLGTHVTAPAGDYSGDIVLSRSVDSGLSWRSAVLFPGPKGAIGSYATGPTPALVAQGRIFRAFEFWRFPHRCYALPTSLKPLGECSHRLTDCQHSYHKTQSSADTDDRVLQYHDS